MNIFRMNWYDFKHSQFMFNGAMHSLGKHKISTPTKAKILFVLNIHRGRWLTNGDLLDFMYGDIDPDKWGDWQLNSLRVTIIYIRKILPKNVRIINQYGYGYKLEIDGEKY